MLEKHVTCPLLAGPFFLELVGYQGTLHNWIIPGSPLGGHPADSPAFPPAGLGIRRPGTGYPDPNGEASSRAQDGGGRGPAGGPRPPGRLNMSITVLSGPLGWI